MPHLTVYVPESDLAGHETELIDGLTGVVAAVYGEWARGIADAVVAVLGERVRAGLTVELVGTPSGRTALGGTIAD